MRMEDMCVDMFMDMSMDNRDMCTGMSMDVWPISHLLHAISSIPLHPIHRPPSHPSPAIPSIPRIPSTPRHPTHPPPSRPSPAILSIPPAISSIPLQLSARGLTNSPAVPLARSVRQEALPDAGPQLGLGRWGVIVRVRGGGGGKGGGSD